MKITVTADVIFRGFDPARRAEAGDGAVVVGLGDVQGQPASMAGDRKAQDMPATISQRGGDPQDLAILATARQDGLDHVQLAAPCEMRPSYRTPGGGGGRIPRGTGRP